MFVRRSLELQDLVTDAAIPKVGKLMTDMLVMALACDLTAVGSLQWSDTEAKHTFPWLDLNETHYFYENGGGYQPVQLEKIYAWYSPLTSRPTCRSSWPATAAVLEPAGGSVRRGIAQRPPGVDPESLRRRPTDVRDPQYCAGPLKNIV